jgi:hypothetical protein
VIIFRFIDLGKIDYPIGAGAKITQFITIILAYEDILNLNILVVATSLVNLLQALENRGSNLEEFFLGKTFIFSFG